MSAARRSARDRVRDHALGFPEAWIDMPWEGDEVVKVGKKIFVFLGGPDGTSLSVKLPESAEQALTIRGAEPTGYGLGRWGWVRVPFAGTDAPPVDVVCDFVEESYRAVAPKRLVARLHTDVTA